VNIDALESLRRVARHVTMAVLAAALLSLGPAPARATIIERVVSPGGIEAWLVREPAVPMIVVNFAFLGGSNQDPEGKPGVARLAASLWNDGAGDLDAKTFLEGLENKAIELDFIAGRDYVRGSLRTLKENRDAAFDYLRLALTAPRFDTDAVERARAQVMSQLRRQSTSPNSIAILCWWEAAFPGHPYGRPVVGTLDSVPRISIDDLKSYTRRILALEKLKISVVGDIDAEALGRLLDRTFGALPATPDLLPVADVVPQGVGHRIVNKLDVPQSVLTFGGPGIARNDPDFMAAFIVNHILGGGSSSSRLYREVREKRGLTYGISESLLWLKHASVFLGDTSTHAEATSETIGIIEREIRRMAESGPTEKEFAEAKSYLKNSFVLGLDTSSKIAGLLVQMQLANLGLDYIERRDGLIDAVTLDDTRRVAKRLLGAGLLVSVAGRPLDIAKETGD
jgi:zinc protease